MEEKLTEEQLEKIQNKIAILKPYRKIIDAWVYKYIKLNIKKD